MKRFAVSLKTPISTSLSCIPLGTPEGVLIKALPSNEFPFMTSSRCEIVRVLCCWLDWKQESENLRLPQWRFAENYNCAPNWKKWSPLLSLFLLQLWAVQEAGLLFVKKNNLTTQHWKKLTHQHLGTNEVYPGKFQTSTQSRTQVLPW